MATMMVQRQAQPTVNKQMTMTLLKNLVTLLVYFTF